MLLRLILVVSFVCLSRCDTAEVKKGVKRGLDDHYYRAQFFGNTYDVNHLISASKQAAHDVFLAQQYVNAAKDDLVLAQKLVKEKEAQALIAHQKSESAVHALRKEVQNAAFAQQKLTSAKQHLADQQLRQAFKDAEASKAIQATANHAHAEIQKSKPSYAPFGWHAPVYGIKPIVPLSI